MIDHVRVPTDTAAPTGTTNACLVGTSDPLLVDPADRTAELDALLADREPAHLALTHHHPDHTGGVAACVEAYGLTVWARAGRESAFEAATGVSPDRTFREGTIIPAGEGIQVLDTPGHAPEHVAFGCGKELVVGDLAVAEGSVVVGAPEGDMRAYVGSLRRIHAYDPDRLYPGHGPAIDEPRGACKRLIDHRRDREDRVRAAVREGVDSLDDLVAAVYEKDISDVYRLARATVRAHVEKLAVEGDVRWDGEQVRPA